MREETIAVGGSEFRWGPIWGGLFVLAGLQIVLQFFGVAIGVSALGRGSAEGVTIWTGIWAVVSTWIAFFAGGWFAAGAARQDRRGAVWYGLAVWGLGLTVGIFLATPGIIGAVELARALLLPPGIAGAQRGYTVAAAWATFGAVLIAAACAVGGALLAGVSPSRRERVTRVERPSGVVTGPIVPTPTT